MKKRLALVLGAVLVLALAAVWLDPTGVLPGYLRGEPFYRSRPTRYWRKELGDDRPGVRANAVQELADGGTSAVPVLVDLLRSKKSAAEVRWTAASVLGRIGPDTEAA